MVLVDLEDPADLVVLVDSEDPAGTVVPVDLVVHLVLDQVRLMELHHLELLEDLEVVVELKDLEDSVDQVLVALED